MANLVLLEPELAGLPEGSLRGSSRGWRESVERALRRLRPRPVSEALALEAALDRVHLFASLEVLRRNSDPAGLSLDPFDMRGLG
jgi:hypothetical protein